MDSSVASGTNSLHRLKGTSTLTKEYVQNEKIMFTNKFVRNLFLKKCFSQEKGILKSFIFNFKFRGRHHLE